MIADDARTGAATERLQSVRVLARARPDADPICRPPAREWRRVGSQRGLAATLGGSPALFGGNRAAIRPDTRDHRDTLPPIGRVARDSSQRFVVNREGHPPLVARRGSPALVARRCVMGAGDPRPWQHIVVNRAGHPPFVAPRLERGAPRWSGVHQRTLTVLSAWRPANTSPARAQPAPQGRARCPSVHSVHGAQASTSLGEVDRPQAAKPPRTGGWLRHDTPLSARGTQTHAA